MQSCNVYMYTHKVNPFRKNDVKNNIFSLNFVSHIKFFCICYTSFLRLDGFNMEWYMIFIVCRHVIHVSTLFYLSFFDCSPKVQSKGLLGDIAIYHYSTPELTSHHTVLRYFIQPNVECATLLLLYYVALPVSIPLAQKHNFLHFVECKCPKM